MISLGEGSTKEEESNGERHGMGERSGKFISIGIERLQKGVENEGFERSWGAEKFKHTGELARWRRRGGKSKHGKQELKIWRPACLSRAFQEQGTVQKHSHGPDRDVPKRVSFKSRSGSLFENSSKSSRKLY